MLVLQLFSPVISNMTLLVSLIIVALLMLNVSCDLYNKQYCGDYQIIRNGTECEETSNGGAVYCADKRGVSGCFCLDGFVRNRQSGLCYPKDSDAPESGGQKPDDPACPDGETYSDCGSACPITCENMNEEISACITLCSKGCFCNAGLVRNRDGKCVSPAMCSGIVDPRCGRNQEYYACGSKCQLSCARPVLNIQCIKGCESGCFCKPGYLKNSRGVCVRRETCIPRCQRNEVYLECGSSCERSCDRLEVNYLCVHRCKSGCFCRDGYVRNDANICVRQETCPKWCGGPGSNEHFACGSACDNTCSTLGETCPIVNIKCNDKCYCDPGYARDSDDRCIPEEQCDISK